MSDDFQTWSADVRRLHRALVALEPAATDLGVHRPAGEPWFELLARKLLPQLDNPPLLVVSVVGGTNIGKSLLFNHLAGENASGVSPLAAGTKHPVCLVPSGFDEAESLAGWFEGFQLERWRDSADALGDDPVHRLFWRVGAQVPERLLLLDTPDVDSDVQVNWQRSEHIRQASDVVITILTQQKYNDAAVKRFVRESVEADKVLVFVFNQVDLKEDREYWPQWLETVTRETGAEPELVYVVPYDRQAAKDGRLPFYNVGRDGRTPPAEPSSLRDDLAQLHFDAIKIRTFRGAVSQVLDPERGCPSYLARVAAASGEFASAAQALSAAEMARVQWPSLPADVFVEEIRAWWDLRRSDWSRRLHGAYYIVGQGVTWPIRAAWRSMSSERRDPLESFQKREREAIVLAIEKLLAELQRLAEVGNDTLRPRLQGLLGGDARRDLLVRVEQSHAQLPPIDDDYRRYLRTELDQWSGDNPRAVSLLRSLDQVAALARPAITVSLAVSGWIVAGGIVQDLAVQAASHTAGQLATEAAITGGITGGGELLVSSTSESVRRTAARLFRRLQVRYAEQRVGWLAAWLERELLGGLLTDLREGGTVPDSAAYQEVVAALEALEVDEPATRPET